MTQFSRTLRHWRTARRLSQLDLALEADVSARHVSFLETGRARPSREMIGRLGAALRLPLDARNMMLTHAGFAAVYETRSWDSASMAPVRAALDRMLFAHAPYPGIAIDRLWTVRQANGPAEALFGQLGIGVGDSLLDLMVSDTLPPLVENWAQVAHHAAARLRMESVAQGGVEAFDHVIDHLSRVPQDTPDRLQPVVPTIFHLGDLRLSLFATLAQFGTPADITLEDMKIELYFPMDDATDRLLRQMAEPTLDTAAVASTSTATQEVPP